MRIVILLNLFKSSFTHRVPKGQKDSEFDAIEIKKHLKDRRKELLCNACIAKGCIQKDVRMYPCKGCGKELGRRKFRVKDMENFHQRGSALHCESCKSQGSGKQQGKSEFGETAIPQSVLFSGDHSSPAASGGSQSIFATDDNTCKRGIEYDEKGDCKQQ